MATIAIKMTNEQVQNHKSCDRLNLNGRGVLSSRWGRHLSSWRQTQFMYLLHYSHPQPKHIADHTAQKSPQLICHCIQHMFYLTSVLSRIDRTVSILNKQLTERLSTVFFVFKAIMYIGLGSRSNNSQKAHIQKGALPVWKWLFSGHLVLTCIDWKNSCAGELSFWLRFLKYCVSKREKCIFSVGNTALSSGEKVAFKEPGMRLGQLFPSGIGEGTGFSNMVKSSTLLSFSWHSKSLSLSC